MQQLGFQKIQVPKQSVESNEERESVQIHLPKNVIKISNTDIPAVNYSQQTQSCKMMLKSSVDEVKHTQKNSVMFSDLPTAKLLKNDSKEL